MANKNTFEVLSRFSTPELAVGFLRDRGILGRIPPVCDVMGCGRRMTEIRRVETSDGVMWRCPAHKGRKRSIRTGSFVEHLCLSLNIFLLVAYYWALSVPVIKTAEFAQISHGTAIHFYQSFRKICSQWLALNPMRLGGPGTVVQVDERLMPKRRYQHGHPAPPRWVFGMYDCHRELGFLKIVDHRDADTLLPIIIKHVIPGTEIHSDQLAAYCAIPAVPVLPPYSHLTVKHSENFIDPVTGKNTNNVERFWNNVKKKNEEMCGTTPEFLPYYLDEFMWRQTNGSKTLIAFDNILHHISVLHPV